MSPLSAAEVRQLAAYIYDISGIHLDDSKGYLLETRLAPLLTTFQCDSYGDLCRLARADHSGHVNLALIDAISTNETLFFRDRKPFDLLRYKIVPDIIDRQRRERPGGRLRLSVWSAACSTGQELYSIAISLKELLPHAGADEIRLLGTDISDDAVARASYGVYSRFEVARGLPEAILRRYFRPYGDGWRVIDEIRSMVVFKRFNLMNSFAGLGYFDIVFCRNVAIYFTPPDRQRLFEKIARVLKPGGALIVGGAESLAMMGDRFQARHYLEGIYYQVREAGVPDAPSEPPTAVPSPAKSPPPRAAVLRPAAKAKPVTRLTSSAPAAATNLTKASGDGNTAAEEEVKRRSGADQQPLTEQVPAAGVPVGTGSGPSSAADSGPPYPSAGFLDAARAGGDAVPKSSLLGQIAADRPVGGLLGRAHVAAGGGDSLLRRLAARRDEQRDAAKVFSGVPGMDGRDDDNRDRAAAPAGDAAGVAAGDIEDAAGGPDNVGAADRDSATVDHDSAADGDADGDDDKV